MAPAFGETELKASASHSKDTVYLYVLMLLYTISPCGLRFGGWNQYGNQALALDLPHRNPSGAPRRFSEGREIAEARLCQHPVDLEPERRKRTKPPSQWHPGWVARSFLRGYPLFGGLKGSKRKTIHSGTVVSLVVFRGLNGCELWGNSSTPLGGDSIFGASPE